MATKKVTTGIRNGKLFCFNCGESYDLQLPQPVGMASAIMNQFEKSHKNCAKTWIEPVAMPDEKTEQQNADWWLINGERGISSETMFYYLSGRRIGKHESHPSDPDDFRRCYLLLKAVPQWKTQLHKLKPVSKVWEGLVDNWDKLTEMLETAMKTKGQQATEMYDLMKSIGC